MRVIARPREATSRDKHRERAGNSRRTGALKQADGYHQQRVENSLRELKSFWSGSAVFVKILAGSGRSYG